MIRHINDYFAKMDCKIEVGFADILGFQLGYLMPRWSSVLLGLNTPGTIST